MADPLEQMIRSSRVGMQCRIEGTGANHAGWFDMACGLLTTNGI
jgi:hypothetical protein